MKMAVFRDVATSRGNCYVRHEGDDADSKQLRNVGELPSDYTVQLPRYNFVYHKTHRE
jgi:hypothetical protein